MLNRRLIILFAMFAVAMVVLSLRLGHLQVTQGEQWRREARSFVHRHMPIDTARGMIVDRNGVIVAQDMHCFDLAIDYRAMNLDDRWVTRAARQRLREAGVTERKEIVARLPEAKERLAGAIEGYPEAIAAAVPKLTTADEVRTRFNQIRSRIRALRQDRWSRIYDKNRDREDGVVITEADMSNELKDETSTHTVIANIPESVAFYFKQNAERYPGLVVVDSQRRDYPFKDVACHLIGAMRPIDNEALKAAATEKGLFDLPNLLSENDPGNLRGYLPGDRVGESGVERFAEKTLRGVRGVKLVELGAEDAEKRIEPQQGTAVQMTLDIKLQAALQKALLDPNRGLLKGQDGREHYVAIVVMDMEGRILVMLSLPTYDLNLYDENLQALLKDEANNPLINRASAGEYPPGSTIKPLVAAAALSEGVGMPGEAITCNGHLFPNRRDQFRCSIFVEYGATHGPMTFVHALEASCNIYFYTLGQRLGLERFFTWFDAFALGRRTGFDLKESDGSIPPRKDLDDPTTANAESIQLGIGQGKLAVTPLQMAVSYATILRGGEEVTPSVMASTVPVKTKRANISPATVAAIRQGLDLVVHGDKGTARKVFADLKQPVAGKTGSATTGRMITVDGQKVPGDSDAWFVGYVPAAEPKYIIAAVMEFGGHGGKTAAPMVKETVIQMEKFGYLPKLD